MHLRRTQPRYGSLQRSPGPKLDLRGRFAAKGKGAGKEKRQWKREIGKEEKTKKWEESTSTPK